MLNYSPIYKNPTLSLGCPDCFSHAEGRNSLGTRLPNSSHLFLCYYIYYLYVCEVIPMISMSTTDNNKNTSIATSSTGAQILGLGVILACSSIKCL